MPPPPPAVSSRPGDKRIAALKTAGDVRALFTQHFPAFLPALREVDLQRFVAKSDSSLPTFSYAGPMLHHGSTVALIGDAVHTVKPYFGQGVNSAFEDVKVGVCGSSSSRMGGWRVVWVCPPLSAQGAAVCLRSLLQSSRLCHPVLMRCTTATAAAGPPCSATQVLQQALDETDDDPAAAVKRYSQLRAKDAEALVTLSHSLDGGFLTFVGPLILDSMLNRLLPGVFSPNIIASLQNEKWSFAQIRARKRVDRALQVGLLGGLLFVVVRLAAVLLGLAGKLLRGAAGAV